MILYHSAGEHSKVSQWSSVMKHREKKKIIMETPHLGMQDFYDKLGRSWKVSRQVDPNHLGTVQIRLTRNANFSTDMFPGKKTGDVRRQALAALTKAIRCRCTAVNEELTRIGAVILHQCYTSYIPLCCYNPVLRGNCSYCSRESRV